jgi:hypothetical protein
MFVRNYYDVKICVCLPDLAPYKMLKKEIQIRDNRHVAMFQKNTTEPKAGYFSKLCYYHDHLRSLVVRVPTRISETHWVWNGVHSASRV